MRFRRSLIYLASAVAFAGCAGSGNPVLMPQPSSVPQPQLFVSSVTRAGPDGIKPEFLNVFSKGAVGDVAPIIYRPLNGVPFAADASGAYWQIDPAAVACDINAGPCTSIAIASRHALSGSTLQKVFGPPSLQGIAGTTDAEGNIVTVLSTNAFDEFPALPQCEGQDASIYVFAPAASGQATPLRTIAIPNVYGSLDPTCNIYSIAVNSHGTIWVSASVTSAEPVGIFLPLANVLYEFAPPSSGASQPVQIIRYGATVAVTTLAIDSADNLYFLQTDGTTTRRLFRARPDGSAAIQILSGIPIQSFTIGDGGNIIAEVSTSAGLALEEFSPQNYQPIRVISGQATKLDPDKLNTGGSITAVP